MPGGVYDQRGLSAYSLSFSPAQEGELEKVRRDEEREDGLRDERARDERTRIDWRGMLVVIVEKYDPATARRAIAYL